VGVAITNDPRAAVEVHDCWQLSLRAERTGDLDTWTAGRPSRYGSAFQARAGLRLPPLVCDLQIDYSALSLVVPEKNQFRVMRVRDDGKGLGPEVECVFLPAPSTRAPQALLGVTAVFPQSAGIRR
jgi:hypothetical protein